MNSKRKNEKYTNSKAAIAVYNTNMKNELTTLPFCRDFDYGKLRDAYWDDNYASIQLEDYAHFFCALFDKSEYLLIFELDYSQAHKC